MPDERQEHAPRPGTVTGGPDHHPEIDWTTAMRSPEFGALIKKRRSFVVPAVIFFLAWYFGFIVLAGYAEDFMGESIYEGFTVGYLLALTQFLMVWGLGWWYLRRADRQFDPLAKKAAQTALEAGRKAHAEREPGGRLGEPIAPSPGPEEEVRRP